MASQEHVDLLNQGVAAWKRGLSTGGTTSRNSRLNRPGESAEKPVHEQGLAKKVVLAVFPRKREANWLLFLLSPNLWFLLCSTPFYVTEDDASAGAAPDGCRPCYVANLPVPSLAHGYEKDELRCSAHYVTETNTKNRLKALVKPGIGILYGRHRPSYRTNDNTL